LPGLLQARGGKNDVDASALFEIVVLSTCCTIFNRKIKPAVICKDLSRSKAGWFFFFFIIICSPSLNISAELECDAFCKDKTIKRFFRNVNSQLLVVRPDLNVAAFEDVTDQDVKSGMLLFISTP